MIRAASPGIAADCATAGGGEPHDRAKSGSREDGGLAERLKRAALTSFCAARSWLR
jgi:hypothetical protein